MDVEDRIRADFTAEDHALVDPFDAYINDQKAQGRTFDRCPIVTEFYEFHRPPGVTDEQRKAEIEATLRECDGDRRSKMD
jgi:hypothetical protein